MIMISMYDLEDNLITIFNSYKECAEYFKTTVEVIQCYICRRNKGILDKKRLDGKWYRLYKNDESEVN